MPGRKQGAYVLQIGLISRRRHLYCLIILSGVSWWSILQQAEAEEGNEDLGVVGTPQSDKLCAQTGLKGDGKNGKNKLIGVAVVLGLPADWSGSYQKI